MTTATLPLAPGSFADFVAAPAPGDMVPPAVLRAVVGDDQGCRYPVHEAARLLPVEALAPGDWTFEYSDCAGGTWTRILTCAPSVTDSGLFEVVTASGSRSFVGGPMPPVPGKRLWVRRGAEVIGSLHAMRCLGEGCYRERLLEAGDFWTCPECDRAAVAR